MPLISPFDSHGISDEARFVFIHIPKCAGTSFGQFLQRSFRSKYIDGRSLLSDRYYKYSSSDVRAILSTFRSFRCFADHKFCLDLPEEVPIMPMTLIRDPVQRFLSHYFYCREVAQSGIIFDADAVELSLSEYIDKTLYSNPKQDLYNGQCWHLFGVPGYEEKKQRLESFLDSKLFCIPVERVEQSALFLNRNLASTFSSKKVQRLNSSSSKKKPQVSNQLLERIRRRMDLDIILSAFEYPIQHLCPAIASRFCISAANGMASLKASIFMPGISEGSLWLMASLHSYDHLLIDS